MLDTTLLCVQCNTLQPRPLYLSGNFRQCAFVCENCRCKSCGIVLNIECKCGGYHGNESPEEPQTCIECVEIHKRVADLDPELLKIRNDDIAAEDPVYGTKNNKNNEENLNPYV